MLSHPLKLHGVSPRPQGQQRITVFFAIRRSAMRFFLVFAACGLPSVPAAIAADTEIPPGVLIVHSNQRPLPAGIVIDDALRKLVPATLGRPVEVFSEFLDAERFVAAGYVEAQAAFLNRKYTGRNVRVIVAVVPQAFQFVLEHRDRILPGVPVVHLSMPPDLLPAQGLPPDVVGATIDLDPTATLQLALRLQPKARRLVIVAGATERDREWERRIRGAVGRLGAPLEVEYLMGLPTAELLQRLRALSRDSIVYTPGYFADGSGRVITPRQSVEQMAAVSQAPVYGPYDTFLGTGVVGGAMSPYEDQSKTAAAIVVRLLNGTAPSAIPASSMPNIPIVDWRQLRRWNLDESRLPPDSRVRFREPGLWERYAWQIAAAIAAIAIQALVISGLLIERRRRRTAELSVQRQRSELAHVSRLAIAGELTGSIAHEINQPLGAILSNADAADLILESGGDRRAELRQILADIRRDDLRASEVIRRLRALLARHEVERLPFDLNDAVNDVAAVLGTEARHRGVNLEIRPAAAVAVVTGDRIQLQQVLINLVLNAMDALAEAPGPARTVRVSVEQTATGFVIEVRDRGQGIAAEQLPKLFDSFYTTKRKGMGLGLSIARTIVEAHGGRIRAESTPGEGAVFRVELPAGYADTTTIGGATP
jgi:signal transduction histidine kinase